MNTATAAALGVLFILIILAFRWKWRANKLITCQDSQFETFQASTHNDASCHSVQLVHRLCPHNNVVQRFRVEEKDSLDEHLDVLTRKLAEKEGRLRLSKSKIRQTQNEIENLHAIDHEVRSKYRDMMESLRKDLLSNESECKKLQQQIEWVSHRRAELKDEISRGQQLYGKAAAELASNLAELQRGRISGSDKVLPCPGPELSRVTDKPQLQTVNTLRIRKEPQLPHATPVTSNFKAKSVSSREAY